MGLMLIENLDEQTTLSGKTKSEVIWELILAEISGGNTCSNEAVKSACETYRIMEQTGIVRPLTESLISNRQTYPEGYKFITNNGPYKIFYGEPVSLDPDWEGK